MSAYDPKAQAEHYQARAIRAETELDALMEARGGKDAFGTSASATGLRRKIDSEMSSARSALGRPAEPWRAWHYDRDAISKDLLGEHTICKTIPIDGDALRLELAWVKAQGWPLEGPDVSANGIVGQILDAVTLGRRDLLDVGMPLDTVAAATAAREAAHADRERRRQAVKATIAADQEAEAKLGTLRIDRPAELIPIEQRSEALPYEWTVRARDGRRVYGWILDGEWVASIVVRPDGVSLPIPTSVEDWPGKLGRVARATIDFELTPPPPSLDSEALDRLAAAAAEEEES